MYLLDTNICIYFMKNKYPDLTKRLMEHDPSELMISSVTVFELEYGVAKSHWGEKNHQKMLLFLAPFTIVPFDGNDAVTAGRIRGFLAQAGTPIGPYDVMIAGQGLDRNLTVITHNVKEFSRVPDLKIEDWIEEAK